MCIGTFAWIHVMYQNWAEHLFDRDYILFSINTRVCFVPWCFFVMLERFNVELVDSLLVCQKRVAECKRRHRREKNAIKKYDRGYNLKWIQVNLFNFLFEIFFPWTKWRQWFLFSSPFPPIHSLLVALHRKKNVHFRIKHTFN